MTRQAVNVVRSSLSGMTPRARTGDDDMVNDFDAYDDGGLDVTRCVRCQQLVPTSEILQVPCVGKVCEICDEEMTQKSEIVATWNQNGDNSCTCGANGWCDHIEQAKALAMVTGSIETTYSINNSQKAVN